MSLRTSVFLTGLLIFCGCQSGRLREFSELRQGMFKEDVLDIAGSPNRTQRWHGMDRWTYLYGDEHTEKEVHFANGRAVYIGDKYQPEISAEEQDRINEASNVALAREAQLRRESNQAAVQQFYRPADEDDEIRYVPQYVPID